MGQQGIEKCKMRGRKIQSKIDGYGLQATIRLPLCEQETIDCITKKFSFPLFKQAHRYKILFHYRVHYEERSAIKFYKISRSNYGYFYINQV